MSELKYLRHSEIDFTKWNATADGCLNSMVYAYSWYLDAICDNQWDAIILGNYEAIFPLPWRIKYGIKYVYQPFFCQQLGVFGKGNPEISQDDFIAAIPDEFKKIHLQLNYGILVKKYLRIRPNYMLDLTPEYPKIEKKFNRDARQNLKKTANTNIQYVEDIDAGEAILLHRKFYGAQNPEIGEADYQRFENACISAKKENKLFTIGAILEREVLGMAVLMLSGNKVHYLLSAPTDAGRPYSIMHGIIQNVIEKFAGTGRTLDFEGSEIPDVATFYKKWGSENVPYYVVLRKKWCLF
ncbi:MAG: hypothetical protein KG003_14325 [Bacteroidetes bacterium]|nr:hypothetical protein [Bacteroidota bacterium]